MADTDITKTKNSTTRAEIDIATALRKGGVKKQEILRNLRATLTQSRSNLRLTSSRLNSIPIQELKNHSSTLLDNVKKTNELLRQVKSIDDNDEAIKLLTQIVIVINREINFVGRRLKGSAEDFNNAGRDIQDLSNRVRNSKLTMSNVGANTDKQPSVSINRVGNFVINRQSIPKTSNPISANRYNDGVHYKQSQTQIRAEHEQKEWEKGFWKDFQYEENKNFDEVIKTIKAIKPNRSTGLGFDLPNLGGRGKKLGRVGRGLTAVAGLGGLTTILNHLGAKDVALKLDTPTTPSIPQTSLNGSKADLGVSNSKVSLDKPTTEYFLTKLFKYLGLGGSGSGIGAIGGGSSSVISGNGGYSSGGSGGSSNYSTGGHFNTGGASGGALSSITRNRAGGGSSNNGFTPSGSKTNNVDTNAFGRSNTNALSNNNDMGVSNPYGFGAGSASKGNMGSVTQLPGTNVRSSYIVPGTSQSTYTGGPSSALKNSNGTTISTADTKLPVHQRALLDTISRYESNGKGQGYNTIVGGGKFEDFSQHPNVVGVRTALGPSTAAGRYQFIKGTWESTVKDYNKANPNNPITDFSPANQDRAAYFLAQKDYARRTGRDLDADLKAGNTEHIQKGLGGSGANTTWQGFQGKSTIQQTFAQNLEQNKKYQELENVAPQQMPQGVKDTPNVLEKQAGIRSLPINPELKDRLQYAAEKAGVQVEIGSGGQAAIGTGGPRTGSTRHDNGNAADLKLYKTDENGNKRVLNFNDPKDAEIMGTFARESVRAGVTGVGAANNYMGPNTMHIGGGTPAVWGAKGGAPAPFIAEAYQRGMEDQKSGKVEFDAWKTARIEAAKKLGVDNKDSIKVATPEDASPFKGMTAPPDLKSRTLGAMVKKGQEDNKENNINASTSMSKAPLSEYNTKGTPNALSPQVPYAGWKGNDVSLKYGSGDPYKASFAAKTDSAGSARAPYTPPEPETPKSTPQASQQTTNTESKSSESNSSSSKSEPKSNASPDIPSRHGSLGLSVVNNPGLV